MKLKEFLSVRGIGFESINILENAAGRAELARLGARSLPVLSRGDEFTFAQNLAQVVEFLRLDEQAGPVLSPAQLVERQLKFVDAALAIVKLMPDDKLDTEVPNRPRRYRALAHHAFRIQEAFVETANGAFFSAALPVAVPQPEDMASTGALCAYGRRVRAQLAQWWEGRADKSCGEIVQTYYGPQRLHEVQERSTWHTAQHCRQWMMLLEMQGIPFERPLCDADLADLPMPRQVWDG
ncbi:MAG: hypothetical protein ACM3JG_08790 [Thiohalocapsa sp.]